MKEIPNGESPMNCFKKVVLSLTVLLCFVALAFAQGSETKYEGSQPKQIEEEYEGSKTKHEETQSKQIQEEYEGSGTKYEGSESKGVEKAYEGSESKTGGE